MGKNLSKIAFIFLAVTFFLGCSSTKRVPEDQYLLSEANIIVNQSKETSDAVVNQLYQHPNGDILGFPLRLHIFNLAKPNPKQKYDLWLTKNTNFQKFLTHWLSAKQVDRLGSSFLVSGFSNTLKSFGEAPVLWDKERTEKSSIRLKNYYFNSGYFNTTVQTSIDTTSHPKKALVTYSVNTGQPYVYDSISAQVQSEALQPLYVETQKNSLLKSGHQYNATVLDEERDRITTYFRNNGAYDFQKTYINYEIDTLQQNNKANLTLLIDDKTVKSGDTLLKEPFKIYTVSKVNIYTSNPKDESKVMDSVNYRGINIYSVGKLNYRPKALVNANFLETNERYSDLRRTLTTRSFSNLNVFNYPTIDFTADANDTLGTSLIANITLVPRKRALFNPTLDITHSNIQQVGIEGTVGTSFRNVFGGAETLDLGVRGNIGSSTSKYRSDDNHFFDILEYGADLKLKFPRFLFLTNTDKIIPRRMFPSTTLSLGFSTQQNIGLDKQNLTAIYNYNWTPRRRNTLSFDVFNLQFVRNMNPGNYFNVYKSSYNRLNTIASSTNTNPSYFDEWGNLTIVEGGADAFIEDVISGNTQLSPSDNEYRSVSSISERKKRLTENNLILASSITFTRSTRFNISDNSFYTLRAKLESAGNVMNLFSQTKENVERTDGKKTVFDVAYSQYIKAELDYIKYFELGNKQVIALRAFGGIAIPYGNSDNIPFSRSYFAGGSNDNRAWQSYRLGPGRSGGINDFNEANMKIAFSAEYRFNISGPWNMALFADAGNIWNALDNTVDPAMKFEGLHSLQDIALGSGLGLRYDFSFFVIRCDLGFKTYNPAKVAGEKWFREWNFSKMILNVGINYPF